jgi:multiple antibiotic resistance protein
VSEFAQFALITFTSVLFIVDPVAAVPSYLVVTRDETSDNDSGRRSAPVSRWRSCWWCSPRGALDLQGLWNHVARIPNRRRPHSLVCGVRHVAGAAQHAGGREELAEGEAKEDVALTPLAIPILAGPGAISTVMVLAGQAQDLAHGVVVYLAIALTALLSYVTLRLGERLVIYLGQTGIKVMTRIMGLLLAAVATQFILAGVQEAMKKDEAMAWPASSFCSSPRSWTWLGLP